MEFIRTKTRLARAARKAFGLNYLGLKTNGRVL